jgi:hypothetical protein
LSTELPLLLRPCASLVSGVLVPPILIGWFMWVATPSYYHLVGDERLSPLAATAAATHAVDAEPSPQTAPAAAAARRASSTAARVHSRRGSATPRTTWTEDPCGIAKPPSRRASAMAAVVGTGHSSRGAAGSRRGSGTGTSATAPAPRKARRASTAW